MTQDDQKETKGENSKEGSPGSTQDKGRTIAEKTSLAISILILLTVVGLVVYVYITQGDEPPMIEVQPQLPELREEMDAFYLPLDVTNHGDITAEALEVELTLTPESGEPETITFTIDFLAGHATEQVVTAFTQDPSQGELSSTFSFLSP